MVDQFRDHSQLQYRFKNFIGEVWLTDDQEMMYRFFLIIFSPYKKIFFCGWR